MLFALCSLLRHFPYAQQQFLKLGGLQVLRSLVQGKGSEMLAVRVVTLLYDLLTEKVSAGGPSGLSQGFQSCQPCEDRLPLGRRHASALQRWGWRVQTTMTIGQSEGSLVGSLGQAVEAQELEQE